MNLSLWIAFYASVYGVDPALVRSVVQVESSYNTRAIGPKGEIGLMQLRPEYASVPKEKLFIPEVNIAQGVKRLAEAKAGCKHQGEHAWVVCFNVGVEGGNRLRHPKDFIYYRKVMREYRKQIFRRERF